MMKYILFCIILTVSLPSLGQQKKYVLLPTDSTDQAGVRMSAFTLNTYDLYKVDHQIKTFNFVWDREGDHESKLIYISVLPDLETGENWEQLTDSSAINSLSSVESLLMELFVPSTGFYGSITPSKFYNEYYLVRKTPDGYWVAKSCLLETFRVTAFSTIFPSVYGSLNLQDEKVSITQYREQYKKEFDNAEPQLGLLSVIAEPNYPQGWRLWKEYLSEGFPFRDRYAYKFWTATVDNSTGPPSFDRGVSRFIFVPEIGIVGGSYDFYFKSYTGHAKEINAGRTIRNKLSNEEWDNNILEERIIIAEELKDQLEDK